MTKTELYLAAVEADLNQGALGVRNEAEDLTRLLKLVRVYREALEQAEDAASVAHAKLIPHVHDQHCDPVIQIASDIADALAAADEIVGGEE